MLPSFFKEILLRLAKSADLPNFVDEQLKLVSKKSIQTSPNAAKSLKNKI